MKDTFEIPDFNIDLDESVLNSILDSELKGVLKEGLIEVKKYTPERTGKYKKGLDIEIVGSGKKMYGELYQTDKKQKSKAHLIEDGHVITGRDGSVHGFVKGTKHFEKGSELVEKEWGTKYMTAEKIKKAVEIKIK